MADVFLKWPFLFPKLQCVISNINNSCVRKSWEKSQTLYNNDEQARSVTWQHVVNRRRQCGLGVSQVTHQEVNFVWKKKKKKICFETWCKRRLVIFQFPQTDLKAGKYPAIALVCDTGFLETDNKLFGCPCLLSGFSGLLSLVLQWVG